MKTVAYVLFSSIDSKITHYSVERSIFMARSRLEEIAVKYVVDRIGSVHYVDTLNTDAKVDEQPVGLYLKREDSESNPLQIALYSNTMEYARGWTGVRYKEKISRQVGFFAISIVDATIIPAGTAPSNQSKLVSGSVRDSFANVLNEFRRHIEAKRLSHSDSEA